MLSIDQTLRPVGGDQAIECFTLMAQSGRQRLALQLAPDGDRFNGDPAAGVQVVPRPAF